MSMTLRLETTDRRKIGGRFFDSIAKAFEKVSFPISGNANADGSNRGLFKLVPFDVMPEVTDLPGGDAWLSKSVVRSSGQRAWMGEALTRRTIQDMPIKRRNKCYKIFPKGGKLFGGYGSELAFPVDRTYDVMDRLIELAEDNRKDKLYHTAPVAVRFVKAADALISPQNGRETVMFEVLMAKGTKDGDKALRKIEQALIDDPDCRMHWGLNVDVIRGSDARRMYGSRWGRFQAVFNRFNRQNTFANEFTDRMGLSD